MTTQPGRNTAPTPREAMSEDEIRDFQSRLTWQRDTAYRQLDEANATIRRLEHALMAAGGTARCPACGHLAALAREETADV